MEEALDLSFDRLLMMMTPVSSVLCMTSPACFWLPAVFCLITLVSVGLSYISKYSVTFVKDVQPRCVEADVFMVLQQRLVAK